MFEFVYLIFLNVFMLGESVINQDNSQRIMSNDMKLLYNKIMQPIQRISDSLPGHNVEVELDISNGPKYVHIPKQNMVNMFNLKKPAPNIKLRQINYDITTTAVTTSPINQQINLHQQLMQQLQQQNLMQQHQLVGQQLLQQKFQQPNPQNFQRQLYFPQFNQQIPQQQQFVPNGRMGIHYFARENPDEIEEPATPASVMEPATEQPSQGSGRQPVYMDDLKKALDDFEKRFLAKQKENKIQSILDSSSNTKKEGELDEASKPLLKKDLWMALGMKYMPGCQHQTAPPPPPLPPGQNQIPNINHLIPQNQNNAVRVDKILQLLKRGVKSINDVSSPNLGNIQWLQMKIPKRF